MPRRHPTDENLDRAIGLRIQAARQAKGWTQVELAVAMGVQPETLSRYETGTVPLSLAMLFRVARELDVGVDVLLGLRPRSDRQSPDEVELLTFFRALTPDLRTLVLELFRRTARSSRAIPSVLAAHESPPGHANSNRRGKSG